MVFFKKLLENKFSKNMLKRNKSIGTIGNQDYNIQSKLVQDFFKTKKDYHNKLYKNMKLLINDKISKEDYLKHQKKIISTHFTKAFLYGKQFAQITELKLSDDEKRFISYQVGQEMKFMSKFADDIINGNGKMPYNRRLKMYSDSLTPMFEFGNVTYLPEDVLIEWILGITDKHCIDCLNLASNSPYKKKNLPAVPKSGNTRCLSNCCCSLKYIFDGKDNSYLPFILNNYTSVRDIIPTETDYKTIINYKEKYYFNRLKYILTKSEDDKNSTKMIKAGLVAYIINNNLAVNVNLPISHLITEFNYFKNSENFNYVKDSNDLQEGDFISFFYNGKQEYGYVKYKKGNYIEITNISNQIIILDFQKIHVFKEI